MVFLGTLGWVQWYTLGGTVVHFGGYSGTVVPVQWYNCIGTVVQLYWYSAFVSVQWYCLSMQWCIPTCSMCILCMSTEPWCLTWTEALNEMSFFQTQRLVGCFQSCFSARNTENGLRISIHITWPTTVTQSPRQWTCELVRWPVKAP